MPDPATIDTLVRAGGWTLFVFTIVVIGIGVLRQWWVPGWIYTRSEARNDRLEAALEKLTDSVDAVADDIAWNVRDRHEAAPPRRGRPGG